ncbi:hypothetical protein NM208_g16961 [Fusarium decemcellulare]|uniref:Uncharacterized protein n=1 Tax=Fusarium decemcellulare TaxID=57161 RepID=A0ACC1R9X9_9HYPO|nr:hypothetical protein NM208_g16961 [Fusarium decemcellulare]
MQRQVMASEHIMTIPGFFDIKHQQHRHRHQHQQQQQQQQLPPSPPRDDDDDDDDEKGSRERRKIEIKFISDKSRRHITFSKRKAGIMKKVSSPTSREAERGESHRHASHHHQHHRDQEQIVDWRRIETTVPACQCYSACLSAIRHNPSAVSLCLSNTMSRQDKAFPRFTLPSLHANRNQLPDAPITNR